MLMQKWFELVDLRQLGENLWVAGIQFATGKYFHYIPQSKTFWRWNESGVEWENVTSTIGTILAAGSISPVTPITR